MNQNESKLFDLVLLVPIWDFLHPKVGKIAVSFQVTGRWQLCATLGGLFQPSKALEFSPKIS